MEPFPVKREDGIQHSPTGRYLFAAGSVALSLLASQLLPRINQTFPFLIFVPAVMFTLWYARFGPALFAIILSALAVDFLPTPPYQRLNMSDWRHDFLRECLYVVIMGVTCYALDRQGRKSELHRELQSELLELADEAIIILHRRKEELYAIFPDFSQRRTPASSLSGGRPPRRDIEVQRHRLLVRCTPWATSRISDIASYRPIHLIGQSDRS